MSYFFIILLALLLDRTLGEPAKFHPLIGFGKLANLIEKQFNKNQQLFIKGILAWLIAVVPIIFTIYVLDQLIGGIWISIVCGWLAIGWQSLREHGLAVIHAFNKHDLKNARLKTSYLVSRDTSTLDETALSRATIESILENGSDAIFAPLFWLALFGAPGVVSYRLSNTLDAMWGYRNNQFEQFGKFTAKLDDLLNYIPARITALLYTICGNSKHALQAWKSQGGNWYSPNAGVVMASGAGALDLALGGNAIYHGKEKQRPNLGTGNPAKASDIQKALHLIDLSVYLIASVTLLLMVIHLLFVYIF